MECQPPSIVLIVNVLVSAEMLVEDLVIFRFSSTLHSLSLHLPNRLVELLLDLGEDEVVLILQGEQWHASLPKY